MAADSICLHNKFGFCKHGERCRNQHVQEICENKECRVSECRKRHPRSTEEKSQKDQVVTTSKPSKYNTAYIIALSPLQR